MWRCLCVKASLQSQDRITYILVHFLRIPQIGNCWVRVLSWVDVFTKFLFCAVFCFVLFLSRQQCMSVSFELGLSCWKQKLCCLFQQFFSLDTSMALFSIFDLNSEFAPRRKWGCQTQDTQGWIESPPVLLQVPVLLYCVGFCVGVLFEESNIITNAEFGPSVGQRSPEWLANFEAWHLLPPQVNHDQYDSVHNCTQEYPRTMKIKVQIG